MKYILFILALSVASSAFADTYVKGHVRKDGSYVQPHYRSDSNGTKYDNYSTQGNVNPYNGKQGTVEPYKYEPYQSKQKSYDYQNQYDND